jgi:hypothetical protein
MEVNYTGELFTHAFFGVGSVMIIPKRAKLALRLATEIVGKLPQRGDGVVQTVVKLLAIADSTEKILSPGKDNALEMMKAKYDLSETQNEQFVSLFFDTKLHEQFEVHRYALTDNLDIIDATHKVYGRLFFTEWSYGEGPEDTFYHSKSFDFVNVLQSLWDAYDGRLHVTVTSGRYGSGTISQFATFNMPENPLYGPMNDKMDKLIARHRRWQTSGIPRSYMFYGLPGTGKTSFAMAFADRLGNRMLKVDAVSLGYASVRDISFMLENLQPDFFLVDDVDKASVDGAIPTLLDVLQRFKTDHPKTSVLLTANGTDAFDRGMLRPKRIDTWREFPLPTADERRVLFVKYIEDLKVSVEPERIEQLVAITEKLSHDYIHEIAMELKHDSPEDVLESVAIMRKLLESNENAKKPPTAKGLRGCATPEPESKDDSPSPGVVPEEEAAE